MVFGRRRGRAAPGWPGYRSPSRAHLRVAELRDRPGLAQFRTTFSDLPCMSGSANLGENCGEDSPRVLIFMCPRTQSAQTTTTDHDRPRPLRPSRRCVEAMVGHGRCRTPLWEQMVARSIPAAPTNSTDSFPTQSRFARWGGGSQTESPRMRPTCLEARHSHHRPIRKCCSINPRARNAGLARPLLPMRSAVERR